MGYGVDSRETSTTERVDYKEDGEEGDDEEGEEDSKRERENEKEDRTRTVLQTGHGLRHDKKEK